MEKVTGSVDALKTQAAKYVVVETLAFKELLTKQGDSS